MNGVTLRTTWLSVVVLASLAATARADRPKRPFESTATSPRVSPYMNLVNNQQGGATNYQSLVRPQIEQQSVNRGQALGDQSVAAAGGAHAFVVDAAGKSTAAWHRAFHGV